MTKKVFNVKKLILAIVLLLIIIIFSALGIYFYLIKSVSNENNSVNIHVSEGSTYNSISSVLKEKNLIKSEFAYKVYIKLNPPKKTLEFGDYVLKTNYDVKEIINTLEKGSVNLSKVKKVTFIEGKNMRNVIKKITENFNISEKEILEKLKDNNYLDTLINDYWFLTDEIKNPKLYYSLEGYLYPDTYEFYETADIDDIFRKMLDNMATKIESLKNDIQKSKYSYHELLTISSIIELESFAEGDRYGISGVIYNRLKDNWTLGSDVTTYYASKIDLDSDYRDLNKSELNECNDYNTRSSCMAGKLPVGPICNPGLNAISAGINPTSHKYYYYVSDKNGKTYFTKTEYEHNKKCSELKAQGLWIEF